MKQEDITLARRFEENRDHLKGVAYRMLGSLGEAEDAVQETWLRLSRSGGENVDNLGGWLTTVVSRVCLDVLRTRRARREEALDGSVAESTPARRDGTDPEHETLLANSVGLALLVVLDTLAPAERIAFVLHDLFDVPFDDIAPIVERSPEATRQLASRARRRVQGADISAEADVTAQRAIVDAFLTAARSGDMQALLTLLDPEIVVRSELGGIAKIVRGAAEVAAGAAKAGARAAQPVLVDGRVGVVIAPRGRLFMVLRFTVRDGKVVEIDAVSAPERLAALELAVPWSGSSSNESP